MERNSRDVTQAIGRAGAMGLVIKSDGQRNNLSGRSFLMKDIGHGMAVVVGGVAPRPAQGAAMSTVCLVNVEEGVVPGREPGWPPSNVDGFLAWLHGHLEMVPPEYRDTAEIEFRAVEDGYAPEDGGGFTWPGLRITYKMPGQS